MESGHGWRAAQLEGWRLYHNPKKIDVTSVTGMEEDSENLTMSDVTRNKSDEVDKAEGNEVRDIWKKMAFKYCDEVKTVLSK